MGVKYQGFNISILVLSGIAIAYIAYPLVTILNFVEPHTLLDSLSKHQMGNAFIVSIVSATISTLLLSLFGIPLAYFLARYNNFPGKFLLRVIIIIPLVLPPLASGALLLGVFGPYFPLVQTFPRVEFTQSILEL